MVMENIVLKGCTYILTQNKDREVLKDCNIIIENGKISSISKSLNKRKNNGYEVIDCKGKIIIPSFINAHTHSAMSLLRGYRDDEELDTWLKAVWSIEKKMSRKDVWVGAMFSILEMIKSGITCFVDMYFHMDEVMKAVESTGMRAYLGYGMIDNENEVKRRKELKEAERFVRSVEKNKNERIKAVIAPHSIYTCSEELLIKSIELAKKYNLFLTMHLAETRSEVWYSIKKYALKPVEFLDKIGFLNKKTLLFHASWLTKGEIRLLEQRGSSVVHCPTSNMKLATGGAFPYREMRECNVNIALGTDGVCSNNSLNIFQEMKNAALLQKWFRWNAKEMVAQEALDMATINPARVLGLNAGSIEVGKYADIILLDANHYSMLPHSSIVSNIVYSANSEAITDVIINGKFVMRDGAIQTLDEEKVKEKFMKRVERLIA
jgi:5-methylthioadenosine/S-adenosylhomocysteine deaminase